MFLSLSLATKKLFLGLNINLINPKRSKHTAERLKIFLKSYDMFDVSIINYKAIENNVL